MQYTVVQKPASFFVVLAGFVLISDTVCLPTSGLWWSCVPFVVTQEQLRLFSLNQFSALRSRSRAEPDFRCDSAVIKNWFILFSNAVPEPTKKRLGSATQHGARQERVVSETEKQLLPSLHWHRVQILIRGLRLAVSTNVAHLDFRVEHINTVLDHCSVKSVGVQIRYCV